MWFKNQIGQRQYEILLPHMYFFLRIINLNFSTILIFRYHNKLHDNLLNNKPNSNVNCGVYIIPCKSRDKGFVGENGRDLVETYFSSYTWTYNHYPDHPWLLTKCFALLIFCFFNSWNICFVCSVDSKLTVYSWVWRQLY